MIEVGSGAKIPVQDLTEVEYIQNKTSVVYMFGKLPEGGEGDEQ